jgi:hypothetical protein
VDWTSQNKKEKSALDSQQDLELGEREGKRRENPQSKTHVEKTKIASVYWTS